MDFNAVVDWVRMFLPPASGLFALGGYVAISLHRRLREERQLNAAQAEVEAAARRVREALEKAEREGTPSVTVGTKSSGSSKDAIRVPKNRSAPAKPQWWTDKDDVMAVLVSLVSLSAALFVILSDKYSAGSERWAFGAVGTVIGYWLKSRK